LLVRGGFVFVLLAGGPWQVFAGALSWVVLVMVWAALRCDDVQSILSHRTILTNFGLKVVMGETKTTGPDKP